MVPVYKVPEKLLRQCIESLINQTLTNIEIILVDDGSPDHCGAICDEYADCHPQIKVIHKENGGLAAARNSAFDLASGEFITFVDGDDFLEFNACEIAYQTAQEKKVQLVFWDQITEYPHSSQIVITDTGGSREYHGSECKELQVRVLDFNGKIAQAFSKLIRRDFLAENQIRHKDELKQGAEGFIFNIALFEYLESAYYLSKPLYHYVYNENSISHSHDEKNYYYIIRCFEAIEKYIQNSTNRESLQSNLYNRLMYVILTTAISGYYNPMNTDKYKVKTRKYKRFLEEPILQRAMERADISKLSVQRKIALFFIRHRMFLLVYLLGKARRRQLANR